MLRGPNPREHRHGLSWQGQVRAVLQRWAAIRAEGTAKSPSFQQHRAVQSPQSPADPGQRNRVPDLFCKMKALCSPWLHMNSLLLLPGSNLSISSFCFSFNPKFSLLFCTFLWVKALAEVVLPSRCDTDYCINSFCGWRWGTLWIHSLLHLHPMRGLELWT